MAKAKRRKTESKNKAPETVPSTERPVFHFVRFNLLGLVFQQVPKATAAEGEQPPPQGWPVQLSVNAGIGVSEERVGQLRLTISIIPDPRVQPYNIVVDVIGTFSTQNGTLAQMTDFCRLAAPGILFPYVRQIIDRTTTDAPFGVVRLDPVNINQLVNQTPWGEVPPQAPVTPGETVSGSSSESARP